MQNLLLFVDMQSHQFLRIEISFQYLFNMPHYFKVHTVMRSDFYSTDKSSNKKASRHSQEEEKRPYVKSDLRSILVYLCVQYITLTSFCFFIICSGNMAMQGQRYHNVGGLLEI